MANIKQVKQTVSKGFQWHVKWVRVMIILSVFAVLAIILFPTTVKKEAAPEVIVFSRAADSLAFRYEAPVFDTTITNDSVRTRVLIRKRIPASVDMHPASQGWYFDSVRNKWIQTVRVSRDQPAPPPPPDKSLDTATQAPAPIQIQIVEAPKPFDWKGTVTWIIGAINGLVLVIMNLRNILIKKTT